MPQSSRPRAAAGSSAPGSRQPSGKPRPEGMRGAGPNGAYRRDGRPVQGAPHRSPVEVRVHRPASAPAEGARADSRQGAPANPDRGFKKGKQKRKAAKGPKNAKARKSKRAAAQRSAANGNASQRPAQKPAKAPREKAGAPAGKAAANGSVAVTRALIAFIVVAVVALGFSFLYTVPVLPVKSIQIEGAEHVTRSEIARIAEVSEGSNILRVNPGSIEQRLQDSPWVESAQVSRKFPDTVTINVTEDKIAAVVKIVSKQTKRDETWLLDTEGRWLMQVPDEGSDEAEGVPESVYADMAKVLTISEVPVGPAPVAGTKCTDAPILNALDIVAGLSTELRDQVVQVNAGKNHDASLILGDGIEISFGDAEDIRTKERICLQLMEDYPGQIAYINVRVVDRPAWRSY